MSQGPQDTLKTRSRLTAGGREYAYYSLPAAESAGIGDLSRMPVSMKVLLENLLRFEDGSTVTVDDIEAVGDWKRAAGEREIAYRPARVLMQDFTGVPGVADLAAMREAVQAAGKDPSIINPLSPVDLVIDHSVMVDRFGTDSAFEENVDIEMERNAERYRFLRWGQKAFDNFRVVPPGTGICHQVNLEYLSKAVWTKEEGGETVAYPDTLVGTDSHTTMVNGLGVLGWGVGGIEAEAAMLGQPISMLVPEVIGFELTGELADGITATDLVLTVVQMLRAKGVVGKFVEFYGDGLEHLSLADRATIANMAPEYGATCGFFPIDAEAINYLRLSGRDEETCALVEAYCRAQGMWREQGSPAPEFTDTLHLDLASVVPSLAGPKRPQDRVAMNDLGRAFTEALELSGKGAEPDKQVPVAGEDYTLGHGDVVIAAITSCTNTSNPAVMLGAGLVAKKALERGLKVKPWVKTSLAPGSKVVTEYLEASKLQDPLDALGFNLVGYGCTTCIGNSGPLPEAIEAAITEGDLVVASVLSGNRNFEGRVHQLVRTNWMASPPLVVAYAIAGTTKIDLTTDPIGQDADGKDVFLKDIWPSTAEVREVVNQVDAEMFRRQYADVFTGTASWQAIDVSDAKTYTWPESTYIKSPPFFTNFGGEPQSEAVSGARILAVLGDSVTTDHISPAGAIAQDSPAGSYLMERQVGPADFNSYGSRRGNHEVMMRGTFANTRIRNEMVPGVEGGYTKHVPSGEQMPIYDAAMKYAEAATPLVVVAGKEYGTGSSRDWAAKGTYLLGVKAVIAESFERIHRSNLIGMGVLPLQFEDGTSRRTLSIDGSETIDILPVEGGLTPRCNVTVRITREDGTTTDTVAVCRLDTENEIAYFRAGGILSYVLNDLVENTA
ncbi:MAG: aconitate hydratase AcnA [Pseudomonadales bacterium]|jgi:aconitate hydratase|nr:aconitate hydratase AcnA [Pseudomonadales bacterium]